MLQIGLYLLRHLFATGGLDALSLSFVLFQQFCKASRVMSVYGPDPGDHTVNQFLWALHFKTIFVLVFEGVYVHSHKISKDTRL